MTFGGHKHEAPAIAGHSQNFLQPVSEVTTVTVLSFAYLPDWLEANTGIQQRISQWTTGFGSKSSWSLSALSTRGRVHVSACQLEMS